MNRHILLPKTKSSFEYWSLKRDFLRKSASLTIESINLTDLFIALISKGSNLNLLKIVIYIIKICEREGQIIPNEKITLAKLQAYNNTYSE